jgi:bifunctional DNase/RNase
MVLPVEVLGLYVDPGSGSSIVLLGEPKNVTRVVPIFIGQSEAQSIAIALQGVMLPRPGTHDLLVNVLGMIDVNLVRVTVTGLRDGAFIAELQLETPSGELLVDSRPSDGIALAVRVGAEICVEQLVLDEAGVEVQHQANQPFDEQQIEDIVAEFHGFLATAEPSDFEVEAERDPGDQDQDDEQANDDPEP